MSNEDLEKRAWQIYRDAVKTIEFPENVKVLEKEDGTISFHMTLYHEASGVGLFIYKPSTSVIIDLLTMMENSEFGTPDALNISLSEHSATGIAYLMLKNFHLEVSDAFDSIFDVALFTMMQGIAAMKLSSSTVSENRQREWGQRSAELWKDFWAKRIKSVESRVMEEINDIEKRQAPVKHLLAYYYELSIKDWDEAKKFYKRNKNLKNWQKMVEAGFEDLPADLIARLADPDPYHATPSSIALEHAARFCSIRNNSFGVRSLQKLLKESREWIGKAGKEELEREIDKYNRRMINEVQVLYKVAKLSGKEIDWSDMPVFHQELVRKFSHVFENVVNGTIPEEYLSPGEISENNQN